MYSAAQLARSALAPAQPQAPAIKAVAVSEVSATAPIAQIRYVDPDLASQIVSDQGGIERCSEVRLQLIRRFAAASVLAEQLEAKLANGEPIDIAEHAAVASTLDRLVARIGIDRAMKQIVPELSDYIEDRAE